MDKTANLIEQVKRLFEITGTLIGPNGCPWDQKQTLKTIKKFNDKNINLINISPQKVDAPSGSSWLPIVPGTDTALMLGIAYELESKDLVDRNFLKNYSVGYEKFKLYLTGQKDGQPKNAEWAEKICGISAETIRSIAVKISQERTLITVAWSLQRAQKWRTTILDGYYFSSYARTDRIAWRRNRFWLWCNWRSWKSNKKFLEV